MKQRIIHVVLAVCLVWPFAGNCGESGKPELLPDLTLTVPDNDIYREYLGLSAAPGERFSIAEIQADILLIELFSMYCPYCQKEAPLVNELFEKMEELSQNGGPVVKMIGLGASNSQFEVEHFRDTYNVRFPLFPDKEMSMYKALAGAGTPGFIGCRLKGGESPVIVLRNSGGFYNSDDFLQELVKKAGL
ncbi:MAG: TlpA family protein disulfide reductase [Desulforhopalus sp.]